MHIAIRQRRVKSEYKPWLTNEIKQMSYRRDYLKKQSIKLRSAYYDKAYKRCKNKLNNLIKETKQEYFRDKLSNAKNSKESWRTINVLLNKKPKTSEVKELDINGQLITDNDKIADAFNQYFSTIGSTLSDKITGNCTDPMNFVTPLDGSIFNFTSITLQETIDALNEIKTKKSPGLDAISIRLLKDASNIVAGPLQDVAVRQIKCGIPQGSNLGPILFLLYINDLPNCLETTKANLFADDTSLSCEGFSPYEIEIKLNKDIENVHRLLPESPRWLLLKGKEEEAEAVLVKIARMNKRPLPDDFALQKPVVSEREQALNNFLMTGKLLRKS
ncbi:Hypothetical predicted protein [Paramuricea clavata]|uniref:Reverse transcriptase domain-containing protein n=2 Tax=Paramuricea clavata TaxID=317549 RepID=A0A6S7H9Q7_PARCT|nr:Hypothetical predicted protein [Paramuricea clavata]